jgi:hypothetical protein
MKDKYNEILLNVIKPRFKPIGFKVSGSSFRKQIDDFTLVFNIEKSSWNTDKSITFWFNTGVFVESYFEFINNKKAPNPVRPAFLTSISLGAGTILKKSVRNYSYNLTETNFKFIVSELENDLDKRFVPFISNIKVIEDILIFEELDQIYCNEAKLIVALSLAKVGNLEKAELLVNQYLRAAKYPSNWIDRITIECKRLNLIIAKQL